jgi:hypothetical protein
VDDTLLSSARVDVVSLRLAGEVLREAEAGA